MLSVRQIGDEAHGTETRQGSTAPTLPLQMMNGNIGLSHQYEGRPNDYDEENDADNCHCEGDNTEFVSEGNLLAGKHHFYPFL